MLITVTVIPTISSGAALPFADVPADAWYYSDVQSAYETGLINGKTSMTFEPDSNLTYAEAVKLAACMHQKHSEGSVTLTNGLPDWWGSYVAYAKEKSIIDRDYDWNSNATRAGYVKIFAHALPDEALTGRNTISSGAVPDVTMSHPQAPEIYKLYRAGILTGVDDKGSFQPDSNIKRSEVAAILTRMMNESARKDLVLTSGDPVKTYTVRFETNGGNTVRPQYVEEDGLVVKPAAPTRNGYSFAGWYSDRDLTAAYDFGAPVTKEMYLYARWEESEKVCTVSFNSNGGSAVETQQVAKKEKAVRPADPTRDGYAFAGWYKDSRLTAEYDFSYFVTDDLTLYAKWTEDRGTIKDSWEQIIASVRDGTYKEKYRVGDTKSLDLGRDGIVEMQIAAFDADERADGNGPAAITWISRQTLKTEHRMNPDRKKDPSDETKYLTGTGAVGGWEESELRAWLKGTVRPEIPELVRNEIKPVIKYSFSRDTSGHSIVDAVSVEDVWIPSNREVLGPSYSYIETQGPSYTELFASSNDWIRQSSGSSGTGWWWLRSAYRNDSDRADFSCISYSGYLVTCTATESSRTQGGVVLGFCT